MKKLLLVVLLLFVAAPLHARLRWGFRGGVLVNGGTEPMFGADLLLPMGRHFVFNPNVELSPGGSDVVVTSADIKYDFHLGSGNAAWVGAGIAAFNPERDLDVGLNLLAGVGARSNRWYPYVQVRRTIPTSGDPLDSIAVGFRF